jgi:hypothetical protein
MYLPVHVRSAAPHVRQSSDPVADPTLQRLGFTEFAAGVSRYCVMNDHWVLKTRWDGAHQPLEDELYFIQSVRRSKYRDHVPYTTLIDGVLVQQRVTVLTDSQYLRHASAIHRLSDKLSLFDIGPGNVGFHNNRFVFFDTEYFG